MTLTTERQQFAEQNEMSMEFVNWFFDEKKDCCGNAWFIMAAAMWEGWKGRANREAQPVGFYTTVSGRKGVVWHNGAPEDDTAIYTAPPAPAVPDVATAENVEALSGYVSTYKMTESERYIAAEVWNACRAAMLAQPVSSGYKLPPHAYRELVNSLRDTAAKYHGTQQLREQLSRTLTENGLVAAASGGGNG